MSRLILTIMAILLMPFTYAQHSTIKKQMTRIERAYDVHFIYDSSIDLKKQVKNYIIDNPSLNNELTLIFKNSDIKWEIKENYVLLKKIKRFRVSGTVREKGNREPLIGATIIDTCNNSGTYSMPNGFFTMVTYEGKRVIKCQYMGYKTATIELDVKRDTIITIEMTPRVEEIEEIIVVSQNIGIYDESIGKVTISANNINSVPALVGEKDIIKSLHYIPGVHNSSEGRSDLVVRGGETDQNLILLDGVPIYNISHVGGFFSIFNSDAIRGVSLYKSTFPARFGGRLSSVVDIHTKEGNKEDFTGSVSLGIIAAKVNLEIPIIKGKTSLMVSGRRTFLDLFMDAFQDNDDKVVVGFYDTNLKLHHKFSEQLSIYLTAYKGDDILSNSYSFKDTNPANIDGHSLLKQNWKWGNSIATLVVDYITTPKLTLRGSVSYNRYRYNAKSNGNLESELWGGITDVQNIDVDYNSIIEDYSINFNGDYALTEGHYFRVGASATLHRYRPNLMVITNDIKPDGNVVGTNTTNAFEYALFAEDDWYISHALQANIGIRYSNYIVDGVNHSGFEPRASFSYNISENFSLKAGYSTMRQYIHQLTSNTSLFQADLLVPISGDIPTMKSRQYSMGGYFILPHNFNLSAEIYYKDMNGLLEYSNGASFNDIQNYWEQSVINGVGYAYGFELLLERRVGKTTGALSYAYSRSKRQFNEINHGKWFLAKSDKPHSLNINISQKLSKKWEVSALWTYHSGIIISLPLETIPTMKNPFDEVISYEPNEQINERNNYRMPSYHRLDISFNYIRNRGREDRYGVWNFSIYNLYNRQNGYSTYRRYGDRDYGGVVEGELGHLVQTSLLSIIPSVSYTYNF